MAHQQFKAISDKDPLGGTQLLLLEEGRKVVEEIFTKAYASGASAVVSSLDTSSSMLESHKFFNDRSRINDITYYETGQGMRRQEGPTAGGFCIPRTLVSTGEKHNFSDLLTQFSTELLVSARDSAGSLPDGQECRAGISILYHENGPYDPIRESQLRTAVRGGCDFFVFEGCSTSAHLEEVDHLLQENAARQVPLVKINTVGKPYEDGTCVAGFDVPAFVLIPCQDEPDKVAHLLDTARQLPRFKGAIMVDTHGDAEVDVF
eukprot:CAMPEP_0185773298 /NCGR_PEP_ID=MMETSP1174-20130828/72864_1 /TAXON_ID=35687 /ORGANISM="Dictyocha speculum, Strain CCMP1381" /LENGTH=261 /DNA_ID=CAMNT_0028459919 /DNA_START=51 /DNA_END=836 /DNA_ORIENTATION=-